MASKVDSDNYKHYLLHSMLFGASPEMAGPFLQAGTEGKSRILGKMVSDLGSSPESKQGISMLFQNLGGMHPGLANLLSEDPASVTQHVPSSINGSVTDQQNKALSSFISSAQATKIKASNAEDLIDKMAGNPRVSVVRGPVATIMQKLHKDGYLDKDGNYQSPSIGDITNDYQKGKDTIGKFAELLSNSVNEDGSVKMRDVTKLTRMIDDSLFGKDPLADKTLRDHLLAFKADLSTEKSKTLHQISPELSSRYGDVNEKYTGTRELLGNILQKDKAGQLSEFLSRAVNKDGSLNSDLMDSIKNTLGDNNDAKTVLQMEAAKQLSEAFTGSKKDPSHVDSEHELVAPYLDKMHTMYQAMPQDLRKTFIQSPDAIQQMGQIVAGAAVNEHQTRMQLLQQNGAFQQSQFG